MDKEIFRLDRNGGPDKIAKATYSPKAYRRENAKPARLSTPKLVVVWAIVFGIMFGAAYLIENHSPILRQIAPSTSTAISLP